mgnify:CR=1 FL=1
MRFSESFEPAPLVDALQRSRNVGSTRVHDALVGGVRSLADAATLLSPAASASIEELARAANRVTIERFGKAIGMYAPLYLSNECVCTCTYCGFSMGLDVKRRTLRLDEVTREARLLSGRGFRNILLVSAEHPKHVSVEYVAQCIRETKRHAAYAGIEIAAADEEQYLAYAEAGCDGVVLYQETYDPQSYAAHHLGGPKKKYGWRLDAPERASSAGIKHLGLGALLGLADWRFEALALTQHVRWLQRHCWRSQVNVSLPRINAAAGGFAPEHPVSDRDFVQMLCALRLALPTAGIVLSTRETPALRDRLVGLGVTHMSAGSSTEPGGYARPGEAGAQFELEDTRSPDEVAARLRELGFDPVYKDWEIMAAAVAT